MTVSELIDLLKGYPQDMQVAYYKYSEQLLMEPKDIEPIVACPPRPDGWIQRKRPDKPEQTYLMFPGN